MFALTWVLIDPLQRVGVGIQYLGNLNNLQHNKDKVLLSSWSVEQVWNTIISHFLKFQLTPNNLKPDPLSPNPQGAPLTNFKWRGGGGGGRTEVHILYPKKITTSEFVYPKKSQLFLAYPKKIP